MDSTREQAIETLKKWSDTGTMVAARYGGFGGIVVELSGTLNRSPSTLEISSASGRLFVQFLGAEDIELFDLQVRETKSLEDDAVAVKAVRIQLGAEMLIIFEWIPDSVSSH